MIADPFPSNPILLWYNLLSRYTKLGATDSELEVLKQPHRPGLIISTVRILHSRSQGRGSGESDLIGDSRQLSFVIWAYGLVVQRLL